MYTDESNKKLEEFFLKAVASGLERRTAEAPSLSREDWEKLMELSVE